MIELASDELRLRIDPGLGAGVTSLIQVRTGRELLFQAPWPIERRTDRGRGNESWARGWPGGWNLLFPNAGEACRVDGASHGYHGAASVEPWTRLEVSPTVARFRFELEGLVSERVVELVGRAVRVRTVVRNEGDEARAFVAVEHAVFGGSLAAPGSRVDRLRADMSEAEHVQERLVAPDAPGAWFRAIATEGASRTRLTAADGSVSVIVGASGLSALWLWAEQHSTASRPWLGSASCIGIEPATSTVTHGLATVIEDGSATRLLPRCEAVFEIEMLVDTRDGQS